MCGISGVYKLNVNRDFANDIKKMNALVQHRGPDNVDDWHNDFASLGHTRLSIIDTDVHANQPFVLNKRYTVVFNGEIYNYIEIKAELIELGYSFRTSSDTEVLITAYSCWGSECLKKLNGMFAFCIADSVEEEFFFARDRIGIKPLYYTLNDDGFYIFSEPKQVVLSDIFKAIPNDSAILEYLAYQFPLGSKTFFKDLYILEPGQYGTYSKKNGLNLNKYWSCENLATHVKMEKSEAITLVQELLKDSVNLRLRSDVEIGCYLSGGIDSTIVSSIAADFKKGIKTFTFVSDKKSPLDESECAMRTSLKIGSTHIEESMNLDSFWDKWCKSIYFMDEPRVGYSLIPQMLISEKVRSHLKVVLGGQGGDELFWGYGWNTLLAISPFKTVKGFNINKVLLFKGYMKRVSTVKECVKKMFSLITIPKYKNLWLRMGAYSLLKSGYKKQLKLNFPNIKSAYDIKKFEIRNWLHALLHVEDRSSMSASVESRVPILDHRIVEASFSIPPSFIMNGDVNKQILIEAFNDFLPSIGEKKGFTVPLNKWLELDAVKLNISKILNDKNSFIYNFIPYDKNKKIPVKQLWMIISVEIWYKTFIKKDLELQ